MWILRTLSVLLLASALGAGEPPPSTPAAPKLLPGEGFAITLGDGEVRAYGESAQEAPMGSLAKLIWMRLEGAEWASRHVRFRCTGRAGPFSCWNREGHGRVDVGAALRESCNLAFLAWIAESQARWKVEYGEAAARLRMEEVFAPFLGHRLPPGDDLPALSPAWVGDGDLLRTSPEGFLRWLMEPDKAEVLAFGKRYLAGYFVELRNLFGKEDWWFKTGTGPAVGAAGATSAWVAGGRGEVIFVLHLPRGGGKQEGMARIRAILGLAG